MPATEAVRSKWSRISPEELEQRTIPVDGEEEPLVELRLRQPATFISRGARYMAIRVHPRETIEDGLRVKHKGLVYDFYGEDPDFPRHECQVPVAGTLISDVPDHVNWLRAHIEDCEGQYVERGREPDALRPTIGELAPQIAEAIRDADLEKLEELLKAEEGSHKRESVLVQLHAAIDAVSSLA